MRIVIVSSEDGGGLVWLDPPKTMTAVQCLELSRNRWSFFFNPDVEGREFLPLSEEGARSVGLGPVDLMHDTIQIDRCFGNAGSYDVLIEGEIEEHLLDGWLEVMAPRGFTPGLTVHRDWRKT
jgi:hypothetical protein